MCSSYKQVPVVAVCCQAHIADVQSYSAASSKDHAIQVNLPFQLHLSAAQIGLVLSKLCTWIINEL